MTFGETEAPSGSRRVGSKETQIWNVGFVLAVACWTIWGLLPLYWKSLEGTGSVYLTAHRSAQAALLLSSLKIAAILSAKSGWTTLDSASKLLGLGTTKSLFSLQHIAIHAVAALLLAANWLVYIFAVFTDRVIDGGLGYAIAPLVLIALGLFVLRERPARQEWLAICVAAVGITLLALDVGGLPWISIVLALLFGAYSLVRKLSPLGAIEGLLLETVLLAPVSVGYLVWAHTYSNPTSNWRPLLLFAGLATSVPLILFAAAIRRIPLSAMALVQNLNPLLQVSLGYFVFHESVSASRFGGIVVIGIAVAIYIGWLFRSHYTHFS